MSEVAVDLFCEDFAHREFIRPMVERIARDAHHVVTVRDRSAQGGHGKALAEFALYQSLLETHQLRIPDLAVVAIDANCQRFTQAAKEIDDRVRPPLRGRVVKACPDPHVERWYVADPESFEGVVGASPRAARRKCERGFYKRLLSDAVRKAGHPLTLGGIEFARDIVQAMDLDRASRADRALGRFVSDLRASFMRI